MKKECESMDICKARSMRSKLLFWAVPSLMIVSYVVVLYLIQSAIGAWGSVVMKGILAYICWLYFPSNCRFSFAQLRDDFKNWIGILLGLSVLHFLFLLWFWGYFDPSFVAVHPLEALNAFLSPGQLFHPIVEEFIFRVGVFYLLETWSLRVLKEINTNRIILASALVFGLTHAINILVGMPHEVLIVHLGNIIYATIVGIVYGAIYSKSRNVSLTIGHHVWNQAEDKLLWVIITRLRSPIA